MRQIQYTFVAIGLLFMLNCTSDSNTELIDSNSLNAYNNKVIPHDGFSHFQEIPFKNSIIHLNEAGPNDAFTIQEITKQKQDIKYRAQKIPSELYLRNKGIEGEELAQALKEIDGEQLFYFEFEETEKQDLIKKYLEDDLDANISYLSFDISNDFKLIKANGDTINSTYSLHERNYHVAPFERLIVSFNGIDQNETVQLIYNDQLFGKGKFDFAFASTNYIENNIKNPS